MIIIFFLQVTSRTTSFDLNFAILISEIELILNIFQQISKKYYFERAYVFYQELFSSI